VKRLLIVLAVITLLSTSCIKLGSKAQTGNTGEKAATQSQQGASGLAQNPGELPSLQSGGKSGSIGGINPPSSPVIGQPGSAPLSQSGSTSNQPPSSSINMGELQGLQGGGQAGALPPSKGSGQMDVFNISGQSGGQSPGIGALTNMESLKKAPPVFESNSGYGFSSDYVKITQGQAVILKWQVYGADRLEITVEGGSVKSDIGSGQYLAVPSGRIAAVVVPDSVGVYKFTMTATNSYGSSSANWDIMVYSPGQKDRYALYDRTRLFIVYPEKVKKGEPVFVYWNVVDADHIYLQARLAGEDAQEPNESIRVSSHGAEIFYPPLDTEFRLWFGIGGFRNSSNQTNPDYCTVYRYVVIE